MSNGGDVISLTMAMIEVLHLSWTIRLEIWRYGSMTTQFTSKIIDFLQTKAIGINNFIFIVLEILNKERIDEIWLLGNSIVNLS